jgi:hypothetical protein
MVKFGKKACFCPKITPPETLACIGFQPNIVAKCAKMNDF